MSGKAGGEYHVLTELLDSLNGAIRGSCNDIDCDQYMYKECLKKEYPPVLEHKFSCMKALKKDKAAVMRLLGLKKFRKYRHKKCAVCKKDIDKLSGKSKIVSYQKKLDSGLFQWDGVWSHNSCSPRVKIPKGWKKN